MVFSTKTFWTLKVMGFFSTQKRPPSARRLRRPGLDARGGARPGALAESAAAGEGDLQVVLAAAVLAVSQAGCYPDVGVKAVFFVFFRRSFGVIYPAIFVFSMFFYTFYKVF